MRITQGMIATQLQRNLQLTLAALARQQDRLAAGRRLLTPADDPGGTAQALVVRSRQTATSQFRKNVAEARSTLLTGDGTVQSVLEAITRAREAAVQGANDSVDALGRRALGTQVDQLLEAMVNLANGRDGRGTYLFGGQETTVPPYRVTRDAAGRITSVAANPRGIDGPVLAEVSEGLTLATGVSGTAIFGAAGVQTNAFDVLIRLRDSLDANVAAGTQSLGLGADVDPTGAPSPSPYLGIDAAADLQIVGPSGTAFVGLTAPDGVSAIGPATSALATAAAVNLVSPSTGVTATATAASFTVGGGFSADLVIDGSAGHALTINGQSVTATLAGSPTARRDALAAAISAQVSGVTALAVGSSGLTLTTPDGRNLSIQTDAAVGAGTVNGEVLGFTTGLAAEAVVARGGVTLTAASGGLTTVAAAGAAFADQITGEGTAVSIRSSLDDLTAVLDRATLAATEFGVRLGWLDLVDERLSADGVEQARLLSGIEDLDMVAAIEEFKQMQQAYQAALQSGAQAIQISLLDFLR